MEQPPHHRGGLFDKLRSLADTVLGLAQNRLELLAVELQEEKVRALDILARTALLAVISLLTLMTGTAAIVVSLWDTSPTLVLVLLTVAYATLAVVLFARLRNRFKNGRAVLADTITEFKKDRECLRKAD